MINNKSSVLSNTIVKMSRIKTVSDTDWLRVMIRVDDMMKGKSQHSILEDVEWLREMQALCFAQCAVCRRTDDRDFRVFLRVIRGELVSTYRHMLSTLAAFLWNTEEDSDDEN